MCKDRAEGVEGVEGDGAVGGVGVVLDTIYLSVKNLRCMVHDTAVNRRQNDGPEAEEMLNQTKHNKRSDKAETHIRIDHRRISHTRTPQRDVPSTQRHETTRRQANIMLIPLRHIIDRRSTWVEDTLIQNLDVRTIDKAGIENSLCADGYQCLVRKLLEAVCDTGWGGVGAGQVAVECFLGGDEVGDVVVYLGGRGNGRGKGHYAEDVVVVHSGFMLAAGLVSKCRW